MKTSCEFVVLAAGAICLSGCASLFNSKQTRSQIPEPVDVASVYHDYAVEQLKIGRSLLSAGAYASALEPLRRAAADPRSAPSAYNAIGVAYAKLDRDDVASRFFRLALILDPDNKAFAGNLKRVKLQGPSGPENTGHQLAGAEGPRSADASEPGQDAPALANASEERRKAGAQLVKPAYGSGVSATQGTGRIQRLSTYEVRIGGPRHAPRGKRRTAALSDYPIKMNIGSSQKDEEKPITRTVGYPARVRF